MRHSQDIKLTNSQHILLLQILEKNGNIEHLRKSGLQYSQIANFISQAMENDYITYSGERIILTEKGQKLLKKLYRKEGMKKSECYISPLLEYKLDEKMDLYDIYLPNDEVSKLM